MTSVDTSNPCISIHTPAKGVTFAALFLRPPHLISIHTPAKGVTGNPRLFLFLITISIHTPAKGVTIFFSSTSQSGRNFNPHSRKGSDYGGRHSCPLAVYFNPHSRKGSDLALKTFETFGMVISIHTPAKGVTILRFMEFPPHGLFQSTLPQRE